MGVPEKRGQTDSVRAYIAYPERKDRAPGVVVIHEVFGLTDWEPTVADKLAKNGYVAIVPDLLSTKYGRSPADPDLRAKAGGAARAVAHHRRSRCYGGLSQRAVSGSTGDHRIMGFCWGGGQTFRYTTNNPKLKAAVICYGPPPPHDALARIETPLLGVYGENDARIDASLPDVAARLKGMGSPSRIKPTPAPAMASSARTRGVRWTAG
jgi:carboxymethylenebutenolidase